MCRPSPCVTTVASGRRGTQDRGSWKLGMSKPRRRVRKAAKKPVELYNPPPLIVNMGDPFMKI